MSVYLCGYLCGCLSVCLYVCMSFYLSICLPVRPYEHLDLRGYNN